MAQQEVATRVPPGDRWKVVGSDVLYTSLTDALNSIKSQDTSFESLVNDRGLTLNEIDIGFLTKSEFKAAANGIFEADGI